MKDKTFVKITNKDIYNSIQEYNQRLDELYGKISVHDEKITNLQRLTYSIIGAIITFAISTGIYFIR